MWHKNRTLAAGLALAAFLLAPVAAQGQMSVTGCSTVTLNGNTYVQYDLTFHNSTANFYASSIQLSRPFPGMAADDTCSFVAAAGPAGWVTAGTTWINVAAESGSDPSGTLQPGQSLPGFTLVATRPCCWAMVLHNMLLMDDPYLGVWCLACPTPARARTWGEIKSTYR